jgi:hypothetical protein
MNHPPLSLFFSAHQHLLVELLPWVELLVFLVPRGIVMCPCQVWCKEVAPNKPFALPLLGPDYLLPLLLLLLLLLPPLLLLLLHHPPAALSAASSPSVWRPPAVFGAPATRASAATRAGAGIRWGRSRGQATLFGWPLMWGGGHQ